MATGSWNSPRLPTCRTWLKPCLDCVRRLRKVAPAHGTKLVQRGIVLGLGFVIFIVASVLWRTVLMAGGVLFFVLVLQEKARSILAVLGNALRAGGHCFQPKCALEPPLVHRTQGLVREASGCLSKLEGFATQDGFVLVGAGLIIQAEVRWASELAWRLIADKVPPRNPSGAARQPGFCWL